MELLNVKHTKVVDLHNLLSNNSKEMEMSVKPHYDLPEPSTTISLMEVG